jgi:hypothetical protein
MMIGSQKRSVARHSAHRAVEIQTCAEVHLERKPVSLSLAETIGRQHKLSHMHIFSSDRPTGLWIEAFPW